VDKHGFIGNKEVRGILGTDDVLRASRLLKEWVDRGLLEVANPETGTRIRRYAKPGVRPETLLFSSLSGKQPGEKL